MIDIGLLKPSTHIAFLLTHFFLSKNLHIISYFNKDIAVSVILMLLNEVDSKLKSC